MFVYRECKHNRLRIQDCLEQSSDRQNVSYYQLEITANVGKREGRYAKVDSLHIGFLVFGELDIECTESGWCAELSLYGTS